MHFNTSSAKLLLLPLLLFFAFFVFWYSTFRTCVKSLGPFTQSSNTIALYKSRGVRPSLIEDIFAKISRFVRVYIMSWCLEFPCDAISSGYFPMYSTMACDDCLFQDKSKCETSYHTNAHQFHNTCM